MDPVPDTSKGVPVPTATEPSDGPLSKQRQAVQAHRRRVTKQKQADADGPSPCIPGSGEPFAGKS